MNRLLSGVFSVALAAAATADPKPTSCGQPLAPASGSYPFTEKALLDYAVPAGTTIGNIRITSLPVFDEANPDENNAIYRFANRFHIETIAARISQQLLFRRGDVFDGRIADETSRLLRREKYLYDADIRPIRQCDDIVDLEVITRDVWSFTPELSFGRSGGDNEYRIGLRDINLLGRGYELAMRSKSDIDRESTEFVYKDSNIQGSRLDGRFVYSDNDDGSEALASLRLPFFALDSRRAWQVSLEQVERIDTQYFRGDDVSEVSRDSEDYLIRYGWSDGLRDGVARRWSVGYRFQKEAFSLGDEYPPPTLFPVDKTLSYPFVEYARVKDGYTVGTNLDQIHRTEDVHLGYNFWTRLGFAAESFGSDQDRLLLEGGFTDTLNYSRNIWLAHELSWYGLYNLNEAESEDVLINYEVRYLRDQTKHRSFYAAFQATYTHNLNTNQQLFYGGDTGARAFDNRFQLGDRRMSITLEERMYTDIHLFNLIRIGWAIFIDIGRAWEPGSDDGIEDDYLASAGIGLRLASSKSNEGGLLHIDLAFPLTNKDDPSVDSSEVTVKLRRRF